MKLPRTKLASVVIAFWTVAIAGCQTNWAGAANEPAAAATTNIRNDAAQLGSRGAPLKTASADAVDPAQMAGVMEKVQQVSELDPAAAPRLLAELQRTPPKFWASTAEQFRASLAYQQELAAREKAAGTKPVGPADSPWAAVNSMPQNGTANPQVLNPPMPSEPITPLQSPVTLASYNAPMDAIPSATGQSQLATLGNTPRQSIAPHSTDWRELLTASAGELDRHAASSPSSTAEVHEHVVSRLLHLSAGDTEKSLEPIPGISPLEQDYWSRQVFALATYLDHHEQTDDKRRAAAAAVHLDGALAALREVGSLNLRNLSFCKKVYGYGAYDTFDANRFTPGQPLTVYVEVENYRSRETDKGFVTSLGSSYEIVDGTGERVAGESFPDVEDVCRSRRRDFHIQFGLTLPRRISPGQYHLHLMVRDRQGDKIGTATLAFEVPGEKPRDLLLKSAEKHATSNE